MREPATQIISDRAGKNDGLGHPLTYSMIAHLVAIIALALGPVSWLDADEEATTVMTIRLGGPDAAGEGGLTPLGGRPIQDIVPLAEARRPQWIQPPADTAPEVIVPNDQSPRTEPQSEINTQPEESRGRRLTRGPDLRDGNSMADTGVTGMGVGLSSGGLGGTGSELNLADFCCPEYLATMMSLIRERWDSNQSQPGSTIVRFTILRSGTIESVGVDISSGHLALDQSARRAILLTRQLPPLPTAFAEQNLTVRLTFEYRQ